MSTIYTQHYGKGAIGRPGATSQPNDSKILYRQDIQRVVIILCKVLDDIPEF
jgi:hypothetical protein